MTIRTRMTLLFLGVVSVLLLAFCAAIFFEGEIYRQQEYKSRLRQEAFTAATVLFDKQEISPDLLKLLDKKHITALNEEEIIIYDFQNKIVYESGSDNLIVDTKTLSQIRAKKEYFWEQNELEMFGMVFKNDGKDYIILASAVDIYGLSKQKNLALTLGFGCLLMTLVSAISGWLFVGRLLFPIQKINRKIDRIRASQLSLRLDEGNKTDELAQLSMRFNQMLDRLEKAFQTQKMFVSNASHELRTPLTSITGQIQVSLLANDNTNELKLMIQSVLEDIQQLNKLTNNLLDLTSIEIDDIKIKLSLVNITETIWQVRDILLKKNPQYQIVTEFDENPDLLPEIKAHEGLLTTAFINLIENGLKFSSNNKVFVKVSTYKTQIVLSFQNNGAIIPAKEMEQIFEPFHRGANSRNIKGHGVGLSLVKKITQLHKGQITVQSLENSGTTFTLILPKDSWSSKI
jgi:signal transduction histidine kinase